MKLVQRAAAVAIITIITGGAALVARGGSSLPPAEHNSVQTILNEFVTRALRSETGYLPKDIFAFARERANAPFNPDTDALPALCRVLESLDKKDLVAFAAEVRSKPALSCAPSLLRRLQ